MRSLLRIVDIRAALRAVAPHVLNDPDQPWLRRVRCSFDGPTVTMSATNRYTAGVAIAADYESDGEAGTVDLSPEQVQDILRLFKAARDDTDQQHLQLDVTNSMVTVTDVSGLFPGKTLRLPRIADEDMPDVVALITAVMNRNLTDREVSPRLAINWAMLKLFGPAASAYGQPLVFDLAAEVSSMLVTCGDSFIGALMPIRQSDDITDQLAAWHAAWERRFAWAKDVADLGAGA